MFSQNAIDDSFVLSNPDRTLFGILNVGDSMIFVDRYRV